MMPHALPTVFVIDAMPRCMRPSSEPLPSDALLVIQGLPSLNGTCVLPTIRRSEKHSHRHDEDPGILLDPSTRWWTSLQQKRIPHCCSQSASALFSWPYIDSRRIWVQDSATLASHLPRSRTELRELPVGDSRLTM